MTTHVHITHKHNISHCHDANTYSMLMMVVDSIWLQARFDKLPGLRELATEDKRIELVNTTLHCMY